MSDGFHQQSGQGYLINVSNKCKLAGKRTELLQNQNNLDTPLCGCNGHEAMNTCILYYPVVFNERVVYNCEESQFSKETENGPFAFNKQICWTLCPNFHGIY